MRALHRLSQIVKGIGLLIATVITAALRTARQRREQPPPQRRPELVRGREFTPGQPDPNTPPGEPEVIHADGETIRLPAASVSPVMLALGVALLLFGVTTSLGYCAVGIILIAAGLGSWTWEAMHERHGE